MPNAFLICKAWARHTRSNANPDQAKALAKATSKTFHSLLYTPYTQNITTILSVVFFNPPLKEELLWLLKLKTPNCHCSVSWASYPYNDVEQKPVFPGHSTDFLRLISRNIFYPVEAMEKGISGKVVVSFVVDAEGNVTDVKSPVKIDLLSNELERVVKSVYQWKLGSQGGKNVAVQCYLFAEFKLQN